MKELELTLVKSNKKIFSKRKKTIWIKALKFSKKSQKMNFEAYKT